MQVLRRILELGVRMASLVRSAALAIVAASAAACASEPERLDRAALLDPASCETCHPRQFEEWQSSMHAYAADDPIFRAMNARGQRETEGELGDFCVKCHAPMAVREGLTTDGLNLDELPQAMKGVTCYFCHTVDAVEGQHSNPLRLAGDLAMRGGFGDPIESGAHDAIYSPLHDRNSPRSSELCGACHDIVTPAGVHLERTYLEYQESVFPRIAQGPLSCGDCHMVGLEGPAADFDGVPLRVRHEHTFPGVDAAITDWPGQDLQLAGIARDLKALVAPRVCHNPAGNQIQVRLTNVGAGHMFPSGAAQDRRAWVELRAFAGGSLIFESGVVPAGGSIDELQDPQVWVMRDHARDANGDEAHMFWDVATVESNLLPPAVTLDPNDPAFDHSVLHAYSLGATPAPDRIEVRVRLQAVGRAVLDDLIESGDLDSALRDAIPTFTLEGATMDWTIEAAGQDRCLP